MAIKHRQTHEDGLTSVEFTGNQRLAFTPEGLDKVLGDRKHIQTALKLFAKVDELGVFNKPIREGEISVSGIGYLGIQKYEDKETFYYKVDAPTGSFFVKRIPAKLGFDTGGGYTELMESREAKDLLKDLPKVEVVNYSVGYEDDENLYFVSQWNDSFVYTLEEYLYQQENQLRSNIEAGSKDLIRREKEDLELRMSEIKKALGPDYWDTVSHNMAYDPRTGIIHVFDLNKKHDPD